MNLTRKILEAVNELELNPARGFKQKKDKDDGGQADGGAGSWPQPAEAVEDLFYAHGWEMSHSDTVQSAGHGVVRRGMWTRNDDYPEAHKAEVVTFEGGHKEGAMFVPDGTVVFAEVVPPYGKSKKLSGMAELKEFLEGYGF